jgi:transposase
LKNWSTAALKSRLEPIRKFVHTLRDHLHHILPFIDKPITNAKAEGINRIIRLVKNRASGFRNLPAFADMIYLTVVDLDLPGQIPARFRVL